MGIPVGGRRYHAGKKVAQRNAAYTVSKHLQANDSRPVCPTCGNHFDPAKDGKHYVIGKIPCNYRD